ncbi:hypothetical protein, partial [Mesorhizobium sp. M4A.F.Ca.ET.020.02.1.1]|uniref:hypothetical protein n=1 Tax=Mesorhizobium sp. M4A.F.Ca.ET.020.02.1.1 TaxID=2496652 RepID=UPI001AEC9031
MNCQWRLAPRRFHQRAPPAARPAGFAAISLKFRRRVTISGGAATILRLAVTEDSSEINAMTTIVSFTGATAHNRRR